jgi:hypothetical protein
MRLGGRLHLTNLQLDAGERITLTGNLEVYSDGPIYIDGNIASDGDNGASVELVAKRGSIIINGSIEAGSGRNGAQSGQAGTAGGDVTVKSLRGYVEILGRIVAGHGGAGSSDLVSALGGLARAQSGRGGPGGEVKIEAYRGLEILGHVEGGEGGGSGNATAEVRDLQATELDGPGYSEAVALTGGDGGGVYLSTGASNGWMRLGGAIQAGHAGRGGYASAKGGLTANATADRGGGGGNIEIASIRFDDSGGRLKAGNGGDSGEPGTNHAEAGIGLSRLFPEEVVLAALTLLGLRLQREKRVIVATPRPRREEAPEPTGDTITTAIRPDRQLPRVHPKPDQCCQEFHKALPPSAGLVALGDPPSTPPRAGPPRGDSPGRDPSALGAASPSSLLRSSSSARTDVLKAVEKPSAC